MNGMNIENTKELINLGKRIADLRIKHGYTQDKLAELVNYSTNHISKLELARTNPSFDLLVKLANAFKIELKELFYFDEHNEIDFIKKQMHSMIENSDEKFITTLYKIQESLRN